MKQSIFILELILVAALASAAGYYMGRGKPQVVTLQRTEAFQQLQDLAGNACQTLGTTSNGPNQIKQSLRCGSKQLQLIRSYHMIAYDNNQEVAR